MTSCWNKAESSGRIMPPAIHIYLDGQKTLEAV
jgi:hypothetical protein